MSCRGFFLFVTCCPVRPYYFHKDLTIVGSYLLAACDNIQKGHYISLKQLTNWPVTLFIMSHTCDKLFNSVTPNKSKSKQFANAVWGLFVAIYRCSQAVTALQSAIGGEPLNDSLDVTSATQHTWQRRNWQPILWLGASSPFPNSCLHVCTVCTSLLQVVHAGNLEREALATQQELFKAALWAHPQVYKKLRALYGCWWAETLQVKSESCTQFAAHCWNGLNLMEVGILFQLAGISFCNSYAL